MPFNYRTIEDLKWALRGFRIDLPVSGDFTSLLRSGSIHGKQTANKIVFQPMEGCDASPDGSPGELTKSRYEGYARGGAGIIWMEAVSITGDGRANPRQLWLKEDNLDRFAEFVENIKTVSFHENGFSPIVILQASHSGRYSNPSGRAEPVIAYNNPLFEKDMPIDPARIISDEGLEVLEEEFGRSALLAKSAGFDGIDVKCCHRYLASELLSAYTRKGPYGGSFENRTRFIINAIQSAGTHASKDFFVTSRMNAYDGFEYPYGFGVSENGGLSPDYTEAIALSRLLHEQHGIGLLNITIGNPYVNPHVNRPYNSGGYVSDEDPLIGVQRILNAAKVIQHSNPEIKIVCSGLSYLRQHSPFIAAGLINNNDISFAGFGRMALAYPGFIKELQQKGSLSASKSCITCGKCTELMRAGTVSGCVIRNPETYLEYYKKYVLDK